MRIKAFKAVRPQKEFAEQVASVPYDTVNTDEARALAKGRPWSFLHVVRPEIDLPIGTDVHSDAVYNKAAENLAKFKTENVLQMDNEPGLFLYRQIMGEHAQRGVVACCNVEDYYRDLIKKHEKTRRDKEDDRTRHVRALNANTGPVFLTYRDSSWIDNMMAEVECEKPLYDFTAPDGIRHTVWRVSKVKELIDAFDEIPYLYIADGHHRAAAAARAAKELAGLNSNHTGMEEYNWFLAVMFPAGQLRILPYNRIVHDLNGLSDEDFIKAVGEHFQVSEVALQSPEEPRQISMYWGGKWYALSWGEHTDLDPVSALDVSYLQDKLLDPVLGIKDPRTDTRVEFIGGIRGPAELIKLVDSGKAKVAFSMYPCQVEQMMAIADAGMIMPPKSTWFEPKLRSGLLVHMLDE